MKNYLKNMWVSYALAFVISFMFFIVEPITMYSNNINNFWFTLPIISKAILMLSTITLILIIIINNLLYFFNKKANNVFNVITFICFICTYIQGNYLVGNLPVLNGALIDWSKYKVDSIISLLLWLVVIALSIIIIKKYSIKEYVKVSGFITLAIFAMLSTSLISTFLTTNVLTLKNGDVISSITDKNINKYSKNDNFIILLLDAVDSMYFKKAMNNNPDLALSLKDFTYYPDTLSMDPYTQESIPQILSGHLYKNEEPYLNYFNNAMNNSILLKNLYDNNYEVNIYENEFYYTDKNALKIANVVNYYTNNDVDLDYVRYSKNQIRYILFRYLPFFLKKYSRIEYLDFDSTIKMNNMEPFYPFTTTFSGYQQNRDFNLDSQNNFKFIHLQGAHLPFSFDKSLKEMETTSYYDEVEGCLALVYDYINFLKENNIYDNSRIIIMADHGFAMDEYGEETNEGRQNPILFIKGKNEKHKKMIESKKQISYDDLSNAYTDLMNDKKSTEIFKNIPKHRKRKFMMYKFSKEEYMYELETTGHAWETEKLTKTGREFIRK